MRLVKLLAGTAAIPLTIGLAHAQAASGGPGTPSLVGSTDSPELRGPDDSARNLEDARAEAVRSANDARARSSRAVAAKPEEVTPGKEVRDSKGVVMGRIESAGIGSAVVATDAGKVEVPLEAFGKNGKGLLIAMTKAEFDKLVAQVNKPAD
jgi:hypothetical protein